jgi:hypothetical protein
MKCMKGYWASYNIPYFEDIFDWGGYGVLSELFNVINFFEAKNSELLLQFFSYTENPRAKIFARDHIKVSITTLNIFRSFIHS